jgi:hypothetical protein
MAGLPSIPVTDRYRPPTSTNQTKSNWKSILFGGSGFNVSSEYHSGGTGTLGRGGWHTGTDFAAAGGTKIQAPMSGTVVSAGWGAGGGSAFGNAVLVKLDNGDYMYFAHLSKVAVKKGQKIGVGTYLGNVGSTGNSTGNHLHLEIRRASTGGSWQRTSSNFYEPVAYLNRNASNQRLTSNLTDPGAMTSAGSYGAQDPGWGSGGDGGSTDRVDIGGMGMTSSGFSKKEFYKDLDDMFGDMKILLDMDKKAMQKGDGKSIQWAINQAIKQKITDPDRFRTLLKQTAWFKTYGEQTTRNLIEEKLQPKLFEQKVGQIRATLEERARSLGLVVDSDRLDRIARNSYLYGWEANSSEALDRLQGAMNRGQAEFSGGELAAAEDAIDAWARDYGVEISESDLRQMRNEYLDTGDIQGMKDLLQQRSAQRYSVFADQINEGVNLRSLIDPYLQSAAQLLELDPDQLDMNDSLFTAGKAFQTTDPNSGKIVQRTLADFEAMVRKDERWQYTSNAKKSASDMAMGILNTMGLV